MTTRTAVLAMVRRAMRQVPHRALRCGAWLCIGTGASVALAQPALTPQRRLELWRERVSALRAYAGFESTRRALAASGERYDAMLVSID